MSRLKTLTSFGIAILLLAVLAIAFDHHGTPADQPACPICKTARTLSTAIKTSPPVLARQVCKAFHGAAAGEHQAATTPLVVGHAGGWPAPEAETCRQFPMPHYAASRASPVLTLSQNRLA